MPARTSPRVVYGRPVTRVCERVDCGHEFTVELGKVMSGRPLQVCCSKDCAAEVVMLKRRPESNTVKRGEG